MLNDTIRQAFDDVVEPLPADLLDRVVAEHDGLPAATLVDLDDHRRRRRTPRHVALLAVAAVVVALAVTAALVAVSISDRADTPPATRVSPSPTPSDAPFPTTTVLDDSGGLADAVTGEPTPPDGPIGLGNSAPFWPDAQHRPSSAVALAHELSAFLGWGDSANVEMCVVGRSTCRGDPEFETNWSQVEEGVAADGTPMTLRIGNSAGRDGVIATAVRTDSGWAFSEIGQGPFGYGGPVVAAGPVSAVLALPRFPAGTQEVKWWAATDDGERSGAVRAGSAIRIPASARSIASALVVFVDQRGVALGAEGGTVTFDMSVICCDLGGVPVQFAHHRAVLVPPRADDTSPLSGTDVLEHRFSASGPVAMVLGRYTDFESSALGPSAIPTPVLDGRLVWVLIEPEFGSAGPGGPTITAGEVVHIVDAHSGVELISFLDSFPEMGLVGATCSIAPGAEPDRCGNS